VLFRSIRKSYLAIRKNKIKLILFFVLCGVFRFYGFLNGILKIIFGKKIDKEIYKT
jgi:hypothetical protein